MRGETDDCRVWAWGVCISIHSPHARGDPLPMNVCVTISTFQSTPLMRGETARRIVISSTARNFNPLPSCEGRHIGVTTNQQMVLFQSTPLMRGETQLEQYQVCRYQNFNPLPSCEGRQHKPLKIRLDSRQSIQQKHHSSFF